MTLIQLLKPNTQARSVSALQNMSESNIQGHYNSPVKTLGAYRGRYN